MRRTTAVVTVLGLLLLSGCFKLDADFTVNADETVDGTMIVAIQQEFVDMMEEMGAEAGDGGDLITNPEDLPEGSEVEDYDEDGFVGQKVTFEGATLEQMASSVDTEGTADDAWSLTHEGDEFVFEGSLDMTSEGDSEDIDMTGLMEGAEISISMTFPGEVTETNGEVDGTTVTWTPKIGEKNEMRAVAADEGGGFSLPLVIGLVAAAVVIAGVAALLVVRRRRSSPPVAPAAEPPLPGQPTVDDLEPRT